MINCIPFRKACTGLPEGMHLISEKCALCKRNIHTVAGLLGHAQPSTTLDIYSHAFDKNKRLAGQKLSEAMGL